MYVDGQLLPHQLVVAWNFPMQIAIVGSVMLAHPSRATCVVTIQNAVSLMSCDVRHHNIKG